MAKPLLMGSVCLLALIGSMPAVAHRAPSAKERALIITTLDQYIDTSSCCVVIKKLKILEIRVSSIDPRWAAAAVDGYDTSGQEIGTAGVVLHRGYLTGAWSVRYFGQDGAQCPVPPPAVAADIGKRFLGYHC